VVVPSLQGGAIETPKCRARDNVRFGEVRVSVSVKSCKASTKSGSRSGASSRCLVVRAGRVVGVKEGTTDRKARSIGDVIDGGH
jgi:hypothetical protein